MSWVLDEQRRMLRDSAQSFVSERAPVAHLRALRDSGDARGYSPALWRGFGEQGYAATLIPAANAGVTSSSDRLDRRRRLRRWSFFCFIARHSAP